MADDNGTAENDGADATDDGSGDARRQAHAERERSHRIGTAQIRPEPAVRQPKRDGKKGEGEDDAKVEQDGPPNDEDDGSSGEDERKNDAKPKSKKKKDDESDDDGDDEKQEKKPKKWSTAKRVTVAIIIAAVVLILAVVGILYFLNARHFEKTDDAFVDAHYEMVAPQVSGRVIRVSAPDNAQIEPGQTLFEIDPSDYLAALERAKAAVAEAEGQVAQATAQREVAFANEAQSLADVDVAQSNLDNAQAELRRYEGLTKEAQSQQRLDDLRTSARNAAAQVVSSKKRASAQAAQIDLAASQITAAEANVKSAKAQQATAELNLSYTTVKATTGGRVTQRQVQAGDYVSPGQQVLILVPHDVYVTANYKETQITDMRPGQPVELKVDAFPDETFRGRIDSIQRGSGTVFSLLPPQNATGNYVKVVQRVPVKITFDDKTSEAYERLGPGMSVGPSARVR